MELHCWRWEMIKSMKLYGLACFSLILILTISIPTQARFFTPRQTTGASGVALACAGLLESVGRNPSETSNLVAIYENAVSLIKSLRLTNHPRDVAEAIGIVSQSLLVNVGRNPSSRIELENLAVDCVGDLAGFL